MRRTPAQLGRSLADRLHPRRVRLDEHADPSVPSPASGGHGARHAAAARLRQWIRPARVAPYPLRRGWVW